MPFLPPNLQHHNTEGQNTAITHTYNLVSRFKHQQRQSEKIIRYDKQKYDIVCKSIFCNKYRVTDKYILQHKQTRSVADQHEVV